MCKFTYLGYVACEEPERHYFIRREKCSAKAHLKHWCAPHEQEEAALSDEEDILDLPCPMCADVPVIYDQPLLEIAHSRRSVLPAPHYDGVTGQYSGFPRHHGHNNRINRPHIPPKNTSEALVPRPLNMVRNQVHQRSASETAVNRIKQREVAPDYTLPSAKYEAEEEVLMIPRATYMPGQDEIPLLPATAYMAPAQNAKLPKPLPMPQPMEPTPPSSREASMSPPQNRMGMLLRTIPPGESSRRELESIRERAKVASGKDSRPATPQSRPGTDRSRSGSESSSSSFGNPNPPPPPPPRRKASVASSESSSASSTPSSKSSSANSSKASRRPEHHRKESSASSTSASSSSRSSPPQQEGGAEKFTTVALRTIGFGLDRTASPERGRGRQRRERGGSSSERSDSPSVWRPTISPPQLQQASLGTGSKTTTTPTPTTTIEEPLKQRLVPFRPRGGATPKREVVENGAGQQRLRTPLRLYPDKKDDEKVAAAAAGVMAREEQRAAARPQDDVESGAEVQIPTVSTQFPGAGDPYGTAGVGRARNLPGAARTALRRIKTGQVKTVTIASPRPPRRANTSSDVTTPESATVKVRAGGPFFGIAGVGGGKAQEFEIVSSTRETPLGKAF